MLEGDTILALLHIGTSGSSHTQVIRRNYNAILELEGYYRSTCDDGLLSVLVWSMTLQV
jgi:hypothetical protein